MTDSADTAFLVFRDWSGNTCALEASRILEIIPSPRRRHGFPGADPGSEWLIAHRGEVYGVRSLGGPARESEGFLILLHEGRKGLWVRQVLRLYQRERLRFVGAAKAEDRRGPGCAGRREFCRCVDFT